MSEVEGDERRAEYVEELERELARDEAQLFETLLAKASERIPADATRAVFHEEFQSLLATDHEFRELAERLAALTRFRRRREG